MKSNVDSQSVVDPFACAIYIVVYINKSDRNISRMLEDVLKEIRCGNRNLKDVCTFKKQKTLRQEVADTFFFLQIAVSQCSEKNAFIPIAPSDERVRIVKPLAKLQKLDPISTFSS